MTSESHRCIAVCRKRCRFSFRYLAPLFPGDWSRRCEQEADLSFRSEVTLDVEAARGEARKLVVVCWLKGGVGGRSIGLAQHNNGDCAKVRNSTC